MIVFAASDKFERADKNQNSEKPVSTFKSLPTMEHFSGETGNKYNDLMVFQYGITKCYNIQKIYMTQ